MFNQKPTQAENTCQQQIGLNFCPVLIPGLLPAATQAEAPAEVKSRRPRIGSGLEE
jgi:hypothetical protein